MSSEPSMLPWFTTVLILAFLALNASNSCTPYPVGYFVMILSLSWVSLLAFLQLEPKLLLTVVDLRALDVVAADLGHRHGGLRHVVILCLCT